MNQPRPTRRDRLGAIYRQVCPRCHQGEIFKGTFEMNRRCPVCDLLIVREAGFFLGAMYISYVFAIPLLLTVTLLLWFFVLPEWEIHWVLFVAVIPFLILMPGITRYARVVYFHLEYFIDPPEMRR